MTTNCPHCGQKIEGDDSLVGTTVECPGCGNSFEIPGSSEAEAPASNPRPDSISEDEGTLDEANRFLERLIGNVAHAILGIFRRIATVLQWFFSIKFAKFFVLLAILAFLLAALGGITAAPYVVYLLVFKKNPVDVPDETPFWDASRWQWLLTPADSRQTGAIIVEIVWVALFVMWGIWIGIKSYKRGAIARWRERRRARKEAYS